MKRRDLIRHLESSGCQLHREGGRHSVYINPQTRKVSTVPRHREINDPISLVKSVAISKPQIRPHNGFSTHLRESPTRIAIVSKIVARWHRLRQQLDKLPVWCSRSYCKLPNIKKADKEVALLVGHHPESVDRK